MTPHSHSQPLRNKCHTANLWCHRLSATSQPAPATTSQLQGTCNAMHCSRTTLQPHARGLHLAVTACVQHTAAQPLLDLHMPGQQCQSLHQPVWPAHHAVHAVVSVSGCWEPKCMPHSVQGGAADAPAAPPTTPLWYPVCADTPPLSVAYVKLHKAAPASSHPPHAALPPHHTCHPHSSSNRSHGLMVRWFHPRPSSPYRLRCSPAQPPTRLPNPSHLPQTPPLTPPQTGPR
jgi:hypothetical protein